MTEVKLALESRRAGMGPLPGKAWGRSLEPREAGAICVSSGEEAS